MCMWKGGVAGMVSLGWVEKVEENEKEGGDEEREGRKEKKGRKVKK